MILWIAAWISGWKQGVSLWMALPERALAAGRRQAGEGARLERAWMP